MLQCIAYEVYTLLTLERAVFLMYTSLIEKFILEVVLQTLNMYAVHLYFSRGTYFMFNKTKYSSYIIEFIIFLHVTGRRKCREVWPDDTLEKVFTVFLDVILLIIPLVLMGAMYGRIVSHLWKADQGEDVSRF